MSTQYFTTLNGYKIKDEETIRLYNSVSSMKNDTKLKENMIVKTTGYYEDNDGGHGKYLIVDDNTLVSDNGKVHNLTNGLKAVLIDTNDSVNLKQFGAIGDGETDDSTALQNALNSYKKVIINIGTYKINSSVSINNNNTTIEGESYRGSILSFGETGSISCIGTSVTIGGSQKKFITIKDLSISSESELIIRQTPMLNFICCAYVYLEKVWISSRGKQILMWECFDSRVVNCDIEWGGSNTSNDMGVELRSTNGGNNENPSYEYTNNIYFQGCRFESCLGIGIGSTGDNTNKITFESCKFESVQCLNNNAIKFDHANSLYFTNCFFCGDITNTKNFVFINNTNDFKVIGFAEHLNYYSGSYSGKRLFYLTGTGTRKVELRIITANNVYVPDNKTFGFDSYDDSIYNNGDIHVNNEHNKNSVITDRRSSIATIENGATDLSYTAPSNGYVYVSVQGTYGQTTPQMIQIYNTSNNSRLNLMTIGSLAVTGFLPVSKGDVITCPSNDTAIAYLTFYNNIGYKLS